MGGHPAPNLQRLRDSWLMDVISRFPLPIVLAVAGGGLSSLQRYLDAVSLDNVREYETALRTPPQDTSTHTPESNTSPARARTHTTQSATSSAGDFR